MQSFIKAANSCETPCIIVYNESRPRGYSRESNRQSLPVLAVLSLEWFTLTKAMVHLQINPVAVSFVTLLPLFFVNVSIVCVRACVSVYTGDRCVTAHIWRWENNFMGSVLSSHFYVGSKAGTRPEVCVARAFTCRAVYFPSPSFLFNDIKWLDFWLAVARILQVLWKWGVKVLQLTVRRRCMCFDYGVIWKMMILSPSRMGTCLCTVFILWRELLVDILISKFSGIPCEAFVFMSFFLK